jgi:hypothetical protein
VLSVRGGVGLLSGVEMSAIDRILDEASIDVASGGVYYALASAMKGKKIRTHGDLDKVVRRGA